MSDHLKPPCCVSGTALITGGASGIGKATAIVYAENGIQNLALVDLNVDSLQATQAELRAQHPTVQVEVFPTDVSKEDQVTAVVKSVVEKFGRIDISVHSAGVPQIPRKTHETPLEEWQRVIDINQTAVFLCEKRVITQMLKQERSGPYEERGTIVNIASVLGVASPSVPMAYNAYTAAKHAVIALTKLDSKTYAKEGIRINALCPGLLGDTPFAKDIMAEMMKVLPFEIEKIALGRVGQAREMANAVLFLTSAMGSYMYGTPLVVDGGYAL
ncbi:short chain dehydrogenase/ reductase [Aspergillus pseudoustus]|uniref:Short chain dehydrogenase/ reductase n=1 Tax=Aspergillus pseudoustus TaxID=1810923 RepID=A0ABR4J403_9EURO